MVKTRPGINPLLSWLWDMVSMYSTEEILVPTEYHEQVVKIKEVMKSDLSGIVNSVLDFGITAASVDYTIETNNLELSKLTDTWFKRINADLRGRVPTGIKALAKEYFRERWKNSSFLVLRTLWDDVEFGGTKLYLPTRMWFVDGLNVYVEDGDKTRVIGQEDYFLKLNGNTQTPIPNVKNELIYIQKPFDPWYSVYPIPFIIQRGLYKNLKLFDNLNKKSEKIIGKALEYLFMIKKGTEALAKEGKAEFIYSADDLTKLKDDLKTTINKAKTEAGTPIYATNFDTEIEHVIPEYTRALSKELYAPIEKRLLCGLGLVDIVDSTSTNRKESILNPKPFIAEVESGIEDFSRLITDVFETIVDKNKLAHPKYFSENSDMQLHYTPIKYFISDSIRDHLRSMYDRGDLSRQTYTEVVGNCDIDIEEKRKKTEKSKGYESTFYPPPITNVEEQYKMQAKYASEQSNSLPTNTKKVNEKLPDSKKGLEGQNFKSSLEEEPEELGTIVKEKDGYHVISEKTGKNLGGPYKTRKEAKKRLAEIEYFKHKGSEIDLEVIELSELDKLLENIGDEIDGK